MDMTKAEIIDLLKTLGRNQRGPCEPTLVITESQAQAIIGALEEGKLRRAPPKKAATFGKTPE